MKTRRMPTPGEWRLIPGYQYYYYGTINGIPTIWSYCIDKIYGNRLTYSKGFRGYPSGWTLSSNGSKRKVNTSAIERMFAKQAAKEFITSHQEKKMSKGFIVGSVVAGGGYSFSARPMVHGSEQQARNEVERLARSNPGKEFVYLEIKGTCVTNTVTWK